MTDTIRALLAVMAIGVTQLSFIAWTHTAGRPESWRELALLLGFALYTGIFVWFTHKRRAAKDHRAAARPAAKS